MEGGDVEPAQEKYDSKSMIWMFPPSPLRKKTTISMSTCMRWVLLFAA